MDEGGGRRVVVGVSGSLGSLAALHRAVGEARRTGAEVLAVLAWEPPGGEFGYRRFPCPPLLGECRRLARERLRAALDAALGGADPGVRVLSWAVRGRAGEVLVRTADRDADLLVVGTGPRGVPARALRPSPARYCLTHASCPVLAVPPSPLRRDLEALHRRSARRLRLPPDGPVAGAGRPSRG
ncbi:universal stress protein [Streptacidiphilus sp. ASG 303]|uniref:universal stress protein n=1 Tax=Streptacidiphilus sp. ASG 303 TaxID=2896847 RepID=UPI001E34A799|nr:universal stress protein [Streptacidiphilus sp. ASG 303]MCD0482584.1 universal stress protein [Streptacidiphilus sp. ASG 303]